MRVGAVAGESKTRKTCKGVQVALHPSDAVLGVCGGLGPVQCLGLDGAAGSRLADSCCHQQPRKFPHCSHLSVQPRLVGKTQLISTVTRWNRVASLACALWDLTHSKEPNPNTVSRAVDEQVSRRTEMASPI